MVPRTFTVSQANALVPWLTVVFTEVRAYVDELLSRRRYSSQSGKVTDTIAEDRIHQLEARIRILLEEVTAMGLEVRRVDGMVDFPSWRGDEMVYLCWQLGEARILHWHPMHSGWPERRTIDERVEGERLTRERSERETWS